MRLFRRKRRDDPKPASAKSDYEAEDVRIKGATQPKHRAVRPDGTLAPLPGVERAVQLLLGAGSPEESFAILQQSHEELLSDDAQRILRELVSQAAGHPEGERMSAYLEAHRVLLEQARDIGVEAAWQQFMAARQAPDPSGAEMMDPESQATINALKQFLGTESWNDTYAILEREQDRLTSEAADQFLSTLIRMAQQDTHPRAAEGVRYLELHLTLLRETRTLGLDQAWERFTVTRQDMPSTPIATGAQFDADPAAAAAALKSLLTTDSWPDTRAILEQQAEVLLSDTCAQMLGDLVDAARRDPDPRAARSAVYLELHQQLLENARVVGIAEAWHDFESALAKVNEQQRQRGGEYPETSPQSIAAAVNAFLGAAGWVQARFILFTRQRDLLNEDAAALIQAEAERLLARGTGRDLYAANLLRAQSRLLLRARDIGLEQAWEEFETEI